jgi:dodecin
MQISKGVIMSIAKVIEIIAESDKSWDEAAKNAVKEASKTVRNIKHLYVQDMQAVVEKNKITKYRLNAKITFVID